MKFAWSENGNRKVGCYSGKIIIAGYQGVGLGYKRKLQKGAIRGIAALWNYRWIRYDNGFAP